MKKEKLLLGVTAGIAAVKIFSLVSFLKKEGYEIKVILTKQSLNFVNKYALSTAYNIEVYDNLWDENINKENPILHIFLGKWCDKLLIYPTSYDFVGKLATGIADDLLSLVTASMNPQKVYLSPSMNTKMYQNPIFQKNKAFLANLNYHFLVPNYGLLACQEEGIGKAPSEKQVVNFIQTQTDTFFKGKKVLLTSGGTKEYIDPVRYISNASSGKMGEALAKALYQKGALVTVLNANDHFNSPCEILFSTPNAKQMYEKALDLVKDMDIIIAVAAVSDFKVDKISSVKIKKESKMTLNFTLNPDILKELALKKKENQIFVGFSLETNSLEENAKRKLKEKNLDLIVLNTPKTFHQDTISMKLFTKNERDLEMKDINKNEAANLILERLKTLRQ